MAKIGCLTSVVLPILHCVADQRQAVLAKELVEGGFSWLVIRLLTIVIVTIITYYIVGYIVIVLNDVLAASRMLHTLRLHQPSVGPVYQPN